jgi:hypothetical protein
MKIGKGNADRIGRWNKKASNQVYKDEQRCIKNKILKILKSSGAEAAKKYAKEHGLLDWLLYEKKL